MVFFEGKFLQDIDNSEIRVILFLMLQRINKFFSEKSQGNNKKSEKKGKNSWAEKQLKEMGKLGGKLILM